MSLTTLTNIQSRISPRIFEKILNDPNEILRGPGDTDLWKKTWSRKSHVRLPLRFFCKMSQVFIKIKIWRLFWEYLLVWPIEEIHPYYWLWTLLVVILGIMFYSWIMEMEEKVLRRLLKIDPEACCRKGWGRAEWRPWPHPFYQLTLGFLI